MKRTSKYLEFVAIAVGTTFVAVSIALLVVWITS